MKINFPLIMISTIMSVGLFMLVEWSTKHGITQHNWFLIWTNPIHLLIYFMIFVGFIVLDTECFGAFESGI